MKRLKGLGPVLITFAVASAYAATVDNPGSVGFSSNSDSHVAAPTGANIYTNGIGGESISGSVDSSGVLTFAQSDIAFDTNADANGYTAQLQSTDAGTGTFCPNSGAATITLKARIKITKVAGTSIAATPCYLVVNSGNQFTLTTGTSGSLTGAPFTNAHPKFVAAISLDAATGTCSSTQKSQINTYYSTPTSGATAQIILPDATISPTNLHGTGC